jgi:hypothetical protein
MYFLRTSRLPPDLNHQHRRSSTATTSKPYHAPKDSGEAEQMYERALRGKEGALGPTHTSTLDTVNNLGILYADLGKLSEAE